jgi:hypothetical protein
MTLLSEVHARSNLTISAFTLLDLDSFEQRIDAVQRLWRSTEESVGMFFFLQLNLCILQLFDLDRTRHIQWLSCNNRSTRLSVESHRRCTGGHWAFA